MPPAFPQGAIHFHAVHVPKQVRSRFLTVRILSHTMTRDTGLIIGRFQPFHRGHLHAVSYALGMVNTLLVGIGSSNRSRETANPFTAAERRSMILDSLDPAVHSRVSIHEIPDVHNHMRWMQLIRDTLPDFDVVFTNDRLTARLYRREGMPVNAIPFLNRADLSGTSIRERISAGHPWESLVPPGTARVVRHVMDSAKWP